MGGAREMYGMKMKKTKVIEEFGGNIQEISATYNSNWQTSIVIL